MKDFIISNAEKCFWIITFIILWGMGLIYIPLLALLIYLRLKLNLHSSNMSLNSEIVDNFFYSPISGLVKNIISEGEFTRIEVKGLPIFGDILFSPNELEVQSMSVGENEVNRVNLAFKTSEGEDIAIEALPYFDFMSCVSNLIKGDKIAKYSPFVQVNMGCECRVLIPKTHSLHIRKGDIIWARKSVLSGRQEKGNEYEDI